MWIHHIQLLLVLMVPSSIFVDGASLRFQQLERHTRQVNRTPHMKFGIAAQIPWDEAAELDEMESRRLAHKNQNAAATSDWKNERSRVDQDFKQYLDIHEKFMKGSGMGLLGDIFEAIFVPLPQFIDYADRFFSQNQDLMNRLSPAPLIARATEFVTNLFTKAVSSAAKSAVTAPFGAIKDLFG